VVTAVSPTSTIPDHDLTFSDGTTTIGVILTDDTGQPFPRAIQETPMQRTALKTSTGDSKYSDFELPYMSIVQDDWSGGRGALNFEDDKTRYYDARRVNTEIEGKLFLGARETYSTAGFRTGINQNINKHLNWYTLSQAGAKLGAKFYSVAGFNLAEVWLWLRPVGVPTGTITVEVWSHDAGNDRPSAKVKDIGTYTYTTWNSLMDINSSELVTFPAASVYALSATTYYWIVAYDTATPASMFNYWMIGTESLSGAGNTKIYSGSAWGSFQTTFDVLYRAVDQINEKQGIFYEYKRAMYYVTQPAAGGNSTVYINGDRGAADSNSGDKTYLNDSTKTWTADEWIGCVALITKGPGSEEYQPWRNITDNGTNTLTVVPDWEVAHTTASEYVILGSDKWTSYQAISKPVSDVAVAGDVVYLACTEANVMSRFIEQNLAGVWTKELAAETVYADKLTATRDPDSLSGYILWGSRNQHSQYGTAVWKGTIPPVWGTATQGAGVYNTLREICATNTPWDALVVANVTQSTSNGSTKIGIASGFTTGFAAFETFAPVNITDGGSIGFLIKSTVTTAAADMDLLLHSTAEGGFDWWQPASLYIDTTDMTAAHDGDVATNYAITWTTTNYVYIRGLIPFDGLNVNIGTTPNAVSSVMTAEYLDDGLWTAVTITDGTISSGKTMAIDGYITWAKPDTWQESIYNALTGYWMRFKVSVNLTASVNLQEVTLCRGISYRAVDLPALTANEWTWCGKDLGTVYPEFDAVDGISLYVATDNGAQDIYLFGGIQLLSKELDHIRLPGAMHINGLEKYGEDRENPWVFTEGIPFEIQTQNGDAVIPLPIGEMNAFKSENNGKVHCVNGVYLYFSLGKEKLERYYNRNLDDIGPDREEGLPENRRGNISALLSYPGRVFAAIDGVVYNTDSTKEGYSSILAMKGSSWHEIYRGPYGRSIKALAIQAIPGSSTNRLWFLQDDDICWVGYNLNPLQDSTYTFTHEGELITGYITANMIDVIKAWKSLKIFQTNAVEGSIYEYYRKDATTTWTMLATAFEDEPSQEVQLSVTVPPSLTAKRIQLRHKLDSTSSTAGTQTVFATVLEGYGVIAPKYGWGFATLIHDDYMANLQGVDMSALGISTAAETAYAQIKTWAAAATPLTMRSRFSLYDNKTVIIEPPASRPLVIDSAGQIEKHIAHLTCHEL